MYSKFGLVLNAEKVFERLPVRNAVTWTALMIGYVDDGETERALRCFEQMLCEGILPDAFTLSTVLKACGVLRALEKGCRIHASIEGLQLMEGDVALRNTLVGFYARSGAFTMAHHELNRLSKRNTVSWTSIITAYVEYQRPQDAIHSFEQMKKEGVIPDLVTFTNILKACGSLRAYDKGKKICAEIETCGLMQEELTLANSVIDMYTKCGMLIDALRSFDKLATHDVVSWNTLISGYVDAGLGDNALQFFEQMRAEGLSPNGCSFISPLNGCGLTMDLVRGMELHGEIEKLGISKQDPGVDHALLHMYIKCDSLMMAQQVLWLCDLQTVISWTSLIARYVEDGYEIEALKCFELMQHRGVLPNQVTYISVLKACGIIHCTHMVSNIHAEVKRRGLLHDLVLATSIISAYVKCGFLSIASEIFNIFSPHNVVMWNAFMMGYVDHGYAQEALKCFEQMKVDGIMPDAVSFVCALNACSKLGSLKKGIELHVEVNRACSLASDMIVGNSLVDMYIRFGMLKMAQKVFNALPDHDVISWTTLMYGYTEVNCSEIAVNCYSLMQQNHTMPNTFTFACTLKACGDVGALNKVQDVHSEIERKGLLEGDIIIGNVLVDIYARSGLITKAQKVFNGLLIHHIAAWTSLMAGYARLGKIGKMFCLYDEMLRQDIKPDSITFMVLLSACWHAGLFKKGQMLFDIMSRDYGIMPIREHHACTLGILMCAEFSLKVATLIKEPPLGSDLIFCHNLLIACGNWGDVELGRQVFERMVNS
ncbi:hypothetical protein KP509_22G051900 [Ceratopteris richardii]|nr:hypothetical protein KP509_22G051900 [Ceratopteris richardii]